MATAAENMQAAYLATTAKIAELLADPQLSYSVDGVSIDWNTYYDRLIERAKTLLTFPGVAPAPFEVHVDPGYC